MNKNIIYIGLAVILGLLIGYLIFGNNSNGKIHDHSQEMESGQLWTCSMHPQIMQPEPGDCPICGMDLISAESNDEGLDAGQFKLTKNAMALADIRTTVLGTGKGMDGTLKLSGKIVENEEINAVQSSYFDGRIEKVNVNFEGEEVRKGQQLATIYSPELVSAQQELLTAFSLKESQPSLYKAVRNKLKLWKLSDAQIDQIESSGKVRENFPVYANVSGIVSKIMVEEGDYVKQGMVLLKIANLNSVWAVFDAYENQLSLLKKGQDIQVVTNASPNEPISSKITFMDPILNTATRTVKVRAVLNNKDALLKPGMFVSGVVDLPSTTSDETLIIPESSVLWTGERSVIYLKPKGEESVFEMREVTLGDAIKDGYIVLQGLENGDEIVTNGTFTVDAAAQLKGKKSMMNKEGGKTMTGHEGHTGMQMNGSEKSSKMTMDLPKSVQENFIPVLNSYLKLKDAFVASDIQKVENAATYVLGNLKKIKTSNLTEMGKAHFVKIDEMLNAILKDSNLENQRANFVVLNENIIAIAMNINTLEYPFYVQKCPMANQNKGGLWLSESKEIKNPYYGDAMLTCGSVIGTLGK